MTLYFSLVAMMEWGDGICERMAWGQSMSVGWVDEWIAEIIILVLRWTAILCLHRGLFRPVRNYSSDLTASDGLH